MERRRSDDSGLRGNTHCTEYVTIAEGRPTGVRPQVVRLNPVKHTAVCQTTLFRRRRHVGKSAPNRELESSV